jgi:hypothetical protein
MRVINSQSDFSKIEGLYKAGYLRFRRQPCPRPPPPEVFVALTKSGRPQAIIGKGYEHQIKCWLSAAKA